MGDIHFLPHPIPYQGSKRRLAPAILGFVAGRRYRALFEPFAGSAAVTLAAARQDLATEYRVNDSLESLAGIWRMIVSEPERLADEYADLWKSHPPDAVEHFNTVRDVYNESGDPAYLLYLLTRCVKNAPRFNSAGKFNQSPDKRRLGMNPGKMRQQILGAHLLLLGRTIVTCEDFEDALRRATPHDLVYMDPPYEGVSAGRDRRYHQGVERLRIIGALEDLSRRGVPYILSYDGRCGEREYGSPLPESTGAVRIDLHAGRSSQSTLIGRNEITVESLYIAKSLARPRLRVESCEQLTLVPTDR